MAEDVESPYVTPSHIGESETIGPIPARTFWVGLGAIILSIALGYMVFQRTHTWWLSFLPGIPILLVASIFAQTWSQPGAEHGMVHWFSFKLRNKHRDPRSIKTLTGLRIEPGVIFLGEGTECRGVLALPTINLDLASVQSRRRHRGQVGRLLDGITTYQFQLIIRSDAQAGTTAISRMAHNLNPFSRMLAKWLAGHHEDKDSIDRNRYMVIPAPDVDTLTDRMERVTASLSQAGLEPLRIEDVSDLKALVDRWWTWRPHEERYGPENIVEHADYLEVDGEYVRLYALQGVPSSIITNWWDRLVDGELPVDVVLTCRQRNLAMAKASLDMRINGLASSMLNPGREIALGQARAFRLALETRTRPWDVQILMVVRGPTHAVMTRRASRLVQQCADLGADKLRLLRWEQYDGMVAAQPLDPDGFMQARQFLSETGVLARSTIFSASTLQMRDGVPFGFSGSTPILLTTRGHRTGRHFGWFGRTGAGKGFGIRTYLARRHFADRIRIFMWDSDDVHNEYAGRFCDFLEGVRLRLNTLEDVEKIRLDPLWQVVAFDVSLMPIELQARAFAMVKAKVEQHILTFPGETAFVVDEATTITEHPDQSGALALGHAVQTWRKRGVEVHCLTQRVTDWFGTPVGRKIQGNLSVKWYGAQEDTEISEVTRRAKLSAEESERIASAGTGQGVLIAFGRRVWADLYGHCSPEEYAAYHTDPPESPFQVQHIA